MGCWSMGALQASQTQTLSTIQRRSDKILEGVSAQVLSQGAQAVHTQTVARWRVVGGERDWSAQSALGAPAHGTAGETLSLATGFANCVGHLSRTQVRQAAADAGAGSTWGFEAGFLFLKRCAGRSQILAPQASKATIIMFSC